MTNGQYDPRYIDPNTVPDLTEIELALSEARINKQLRNAAKNMSDQEARILAYTFDKIQRERIAVGNAVQAIEKDKKDKEGNIIEKGRDAGVLRYFWQLQQNLEGQVGGALSAFAHNRPLCVWMMNQKGCGPLISARLFAHIDFDGSRTPSRIWRFAGLDPSVVWEKGKKRPWNADLKRLCFLLGESFVKTSGREDAFYGNYFVEKKKVYWDKNWTGGYSADAKAIFEAGRFSKTTDAYRWVRGDVPAEVGRMMAQKTWPAGKKPWADEPGGGIPMLPPAQIHMRAKRWAAKLFLAHAWWINCEQKGLTHDRTPYAVKHMDGHSHVIEPPPGPEK